MEFTNSSFLWALFALAIPILIHLFHFRRYKTVYFSNVKFLKEVKQERNNIRQLKRWLLLASRTLAIAFMVFAFAQPFLKGNEDVERGRNAVSIYFDNSHSMALKHKGVELIEWGRDRVSDIVNSYGVDDEFQIITNDISIEEQRWMSREDALNYLNDVELTSNSQPLQKIIDKQNYLYSKSTADVLRRYVVSDFQESMLNGAALSEDSTSSNYFVRMEADDVKNIYVDSVWMNAPVSMVGRSNALLYRIRNSSTLDASGVRVTLDVNDKVQSIRELNLVGEEIRVDTLYFNVYDGGWQLGSISIQDYPITTDDIFYFSLNVASRQKVLEVIQGNTSDVIRRIFADDELTELTRSRADRLDYSSFGNFGLIILNELESISTGLITSMNNYVEAGGSVLVIPSAAADIEGYNSMLQTIASAGISPFKEGNYKMKRPNLKNSLLRNIVERYPVNTAVPEVSKYYPLRASGRARVERILELNNGDGMLSWFPGNTKGNVFIQTVPSDLAFSNLTDNWFYAPVIYNIALYQSLNQDLYLTSGDDKWVSIQYKLERKDNVVRLSGNSMDLIPEQRVVDNRLLLNPGKNGNIPAGHYKVGINETELAWLSYNNNRLESEMKFAEKEELQEQFPTASEIISGMSGTETAGVRLRGEGRPLWRLCLGLALLFLLMEAAIIKWMPE